MFTIHSIHDGKIQTLPKVSAAKLKTLSNVWVNMTQPTPEEIIALLPLVEIPEELMPDVSDVNEVPIR